MKKLRRLDWNMVWFSVFSIVIGVLMVIYPDVLKISLCVFAGCVPILFGLRLLVQYFKQRRDDKVERYIIIPAVILIVVGIAVFFAMDHVLTFITYALGAIIVVSGLKKVKDSLNLKKMRSRWIPLMFFAILCIALGIMMVTIPLNQNDDGTRTVGMFFLQCAGVILAFTGLVDFITTLTVLPQIKEWKQSMSEKTDED